MKRLTIFLFSGLLFSVALQATDYYVSSGGNDSNDGSQGSPWLTLQHAVSSVACGDTINVVANGSFVAGDALLPSMPNCGETTTVQSSALANFKPAGYRTNPTTDSANYGKLSVTSGGIQTVSSVRTMNPYYTYAGASYDTATNKVTVGPGNGLTLTGLANGVQVILEVISVASNYGGQTYPSIDAPGGLALQTHYYVINCGSGPVGSMGYPQACGATNSQFQLSLTPGGSPIAITSCGAYCGSTVTSDPSGACTHWSMLYNIVDSTIFDCPSGTWAASSRGLFIQIGVSVGVDTAANTITIPKNWNTGALANGMPMVFSAVGRQLVGTLPAPLQPDQIYYVVNLSGSTFQVSLVPGGTPIVLTTLGTGMINASSLDLAHDWAFRGLEIAPNGTSSYPYVYFEFGTGYEASAVVGSPRNIELDRLYLHDNPPFQQIAHGVFDNTVNLHVHDSWIIGADAGEAQAIGGSASPGPTAIINNFLQAGGEVTLWGGGYSGNTTPNSTKLFMGNYYHKPAVWRQNTGTGAASGACLYDATDPTHTGGEWYRDTGAAQNYQCGADNLWHTTASTLPPNVTLKNMSEHKSGTYFTHIGNIYNGSFAQAQSGEIFNTSQENDSGPGNATDHNVMMYNVAFNALQWSTRVSQCGATSNLACYHTPCCEIAAHNLMIVNPLVCGTSFNHALCGYSALQSTWGMGAIQGVLQNDIWNHNTFWMPDSSWIPNPTPMSMSPPVSGSCTFPPIMNLVNYTNSIISGDLTGDCYTQGAAMGKYMTNSTFSNNVLFGGTSGGYASVGAGNSWTNSAYPTLNSQIGYVNATGGYGGGADYHLAATSPYSAACSSGCAFTATDGTDVGADIDMINMATSGAVAGTPPWDQVAGLRVDPASTQVVFRYTAPTAEACTATIYRAAARIPANQVAVATDGSANSISDALTRELYFSGLQPLTRYWYKVACGGGVLLVGNFLTQPRQTREVAFTFDWSSPTPMQYSSSRSMSNPVSLPAATRQFIPVAANSVVYAQAGLGGPITMLITP